MQNKLSKKDGKVLSFKCETFKSDQFECRKSSKVLNKFNK